MSERCLFNGDKGNMDTLQWVDSFLCAVQCRGVVWAWVVQHSIPVREVLHSAGQNAHVSKRLKDEDADYGSNGALQQSWQVQHEETTTGENKIQN